MSKMMELQTVEMHTGGEPLRIIRSGYPDIDGKTIPMKLNYVRDHLDHLRKVLMLEPRGHRDMFGAILVQPDVAGAHLGVIFIHSEGYGTMCGHGVIALGRYAIDYGLVEAVKPETEVNIQCPCGLVKAFVQVTADGKTGKVRFYSVPAFAFATDVEVEVAGHGSVTVDIGYGGAFNAYVSAHQIGLDVRTSQMRDLIGFGIAVSDAVTKQMKLTHPDDDDLPLPCGTVITDGNDEWSDKPAAEMCVFGASQADRSPCGTGVSGRIALQHHKKLIQLQQTRVFESGATGSTFTGSAIEETKCGRFDAVIVEVCGQAHYTGEAKFIVEKDDPLQGFLLRR